MSTGYKYVRVDGKLQREHRYIWEKHFGAIPDGVQIDHINGDRADNRIENLRLATPAQNAQNRLGANKTNKLGVKGVQQLPSGKYRVRIYAEGKDKHLGTYKELELAELISNEARVKYFGEFA